MKGVITEVLNWTEDFFGFRYETTDHFKLNFTVENKF